MNSDLFRLVLAMDAYKRGYWAGVGGLGTTGQIGLVTLEPGIQYCVFEIPS